MEDSRQWARNNSGLLNSFPRVLTSMLLLSPCRYLRSLSYVDGDKMAIYGSVRNMYPLSVCVCVCVCVMCVVCV